MTLPEIKHTPGPWEVDSSKIRRIFWVTDEEGRDICDLFCRPHGEIMPFENAQANAYMIAAAPDMLAALKQVSSALSNPDHTRWKVLQDNVDAAINKAEGRS